MAFPWVFEENFETGTLGSFTGETDTLGQLDFPGPQDDLVISPARGGYCMRVDMNRTVATTPLPAYVTGTLTLATGTNLYGRLFMYLDDDVVCPSLRDDASYDGPGGFL